MILPLVEGEARKSFAERLRERLHDVERRRTERVRVRSGTRARLTRYDATDPVTDDPMPAAGWLGVRHDGGDFYVVTGGHPDVRLTDVLDIHKPDLSENSPAVYRDEFVELLKGVR